MTFLTRAGTADVTVPAGSSILVSSLSSGTTRVLYGTSYSAGNQPTVYTQSGLVTGGSLLLGPFVAAQPVRIEASFACDVDYSVGTGRVSKSVLNALTAKAGGGQSGATLCTADVNRFTTVATAADSALLPAALPGVEVTVINAAAANSMNVFPGTGDAINALAANTALAVAANKHVVFTCAVAGVWNSNLTA